MFEYAFTIFAPINYTYFRYVCPIYDTIAFIVISVVNIMSKLTLCLVFLVFATVFCEKEVVSKRSKANYIRARR